MIMESLSKTRELPKCPRENASFLSYLMFSWVLQIFNKGKSKTLGLDDLYQPLKEQEADALGDKLEKAWKKTPNLRSCFVGVFGVHILRQGLTLLFIECGIKIFPPIFLSRIIMFYSNTDADKSQTEAVWYSIGIIVSVLLNVLLLPTSNILNLNLGLILRTGTCSMIYRKCMKLSRTSIGSITTGKIVNLMSNDVGKFDLAFFWFHYIWVGPIQTAIVTTLLYQEIGSSAFAGVGFLILILPMQLYLGKKTSTLRFKTAQRTDKRVQLMNEIIQGIQVIKMYAWEKPFSKIVSIARASEIKLVRYYSWIHGILLSFIIFAPPVSIFATLVIYALQGNFVTAQKAFVVIAYFNLLRLSMIVCYPFALGRIIDCHTSMTRINEFLYLPNVSKIQETMDPIKKVIIEKVSARWISESPDKTLSDVSLCLDAPGTLAVIGKVGAGKSSLIQVILGELSIESGRIQINGTVSYAAQEPWLFSGSIRQNILFGETIDKNRYDAVIKACSLTRDLELWPDGDQTVVGERGMSLSGGQKARVNLARAVYRKADIYLLDDPLSAVDAHVGRHLFDSCIKEFLSDKLVILVTHQLQYLPTADQILLLNKGKVETIGSFKSLQESGLDFANLLPNAQDEKHQSSGNQASEIIKENVEVVQNVASKTDEHQAISVEHQNLEETCVEGAVGLEHYKAYFTAAGGYFSTIVVIGIFGIAQVFLSVSDYFVSYWVRQEEKRASSSHDKDSSVEIYDRNIDIYIFSALMLATVTITISRSFTFFNVAMRAARNLHDAMFAGVSRASMYFFNTNPSGRILNRFSKDIDQIDESLPFVLVEVFLAVFGLIGTIGVLAVINPWYLIPVLILFFVFIRIRQFYMNTSFDLKRLQAITQSPIYSHLTETLNGLSTIRALNAENLLIDEFCNHQDLHTSAHYLNISTLQGFGLLLELCCTFYIAIVVLSFFISNDSGGNVGLAITQAMGLTGLVQLVIKQTALLENTMTSVERVAEYNSVDPEPAYESEPDKKPPKEWPEKGEIKFEKLSLSYFPNESKDKVLKELKFEIGKEEKIGIVGRTGAGKSSIINALFRLSYNEGHIYIDSRDTQTLGLHDLRSKISIIPQEPVLFSGTMRYNLDPFDEYPDDKLWNALDEVKLKELIGEMPAGLNSKISEGGTNFSVGERQLVCLARAILRENKILLMDEATANVDPQTDALIQNTIRQKFANCTVLTIAHRLNTVMDSDRILVMDAGRCVEFASPHELLTKKSEPRVFYNMLKETGKSTFESLRKLAEENHIKGKND